MENEIIYMCDGTCKGVSKEPVNCGDPNCNLYQKPLKKHAQCESCATASLKDNQTHACPNCQAL